MLGDGGRGWIRTSVRSRGQIYSLLPLTTRPPFHGAISQGAIVPASRSHRNGISRATVDAPSRAETWTDGLVPCGKERVL